MYVLKPFGNCKEIKTKTNPKQKKTLKPKTQKTLFREEVFPYILNASATTVLKDLLSFQCLCTHKIILRKCNNM